MHNPMEQFEVRRLIPLHLGGLDVSYTNSALWMTIAIALMLFFFVSLASLVHLQRDSFA